MENVGPRPRLGLPTKAGKRKYLVVMGCLVERYKKELEKEIPEVDLFISVKEYDKFWDKIEELITDREGSPFNKGAANEVDWGFFNYQNRVITTGKTTAYLKIAEGCSNRCTYCAIPYIRGPYISRKMEDILEEARKLAADGIKEVIIIAQDTTKYGIDIYGKPMLAQLLEEMCRIEGFEWIRFLYAYPESITDELIETVRKNGKICNYFDIPIQHISNRILKTMGRPVGAGFHARPNEYIENLIQKIRREIPDVIIRTSLIVGFPGEDEKDFQMLYDFVEKTRFDKLRSIHVF